MAKPKLWFGHFQEFYDNSASSFTSKQMMYINILYIHSSWGGGGGGGVAQPVECPTQEPESLVRYLVWPQTSISPSADSRRAVVWYWLKYVHKVLVNHL